METPHLFWNSHLFLHELGALEAAAPVHPASLLAVGVHGKQGHKRRDLIESPQTNVQAIMTDWCSGSDI